MRRLAFAFPWIFLICLIAYAQFVGPDLLSTKAYAQFVPGGLFNNGQATHSSGGGGGGGTTNWDPLNKDPGITLSGGNLTATSSTSLANCSVSGYCSVRAVANHTTGKYYVEEVFTNLGGAGHNNCIGIANSSINLGTQLSAQTNSTSYCSTLGTIENVSSGGTCTAPGVFATGDTVQMAVDLGGGFIWFRFNSGNWNGNSSSNPATGSLGCNVSSGMSGAAYPITQGSNDNATVMTANFGPSYSFTPPSGFGNW